MSTDNSGNDSNNNPPKVDLSPGQRFGHLTFVGLVKREPTPEDDTSAWFHMACDCGKDDLRPWLIVNPDDDHSRCRDCNEKRRKANEAKAEARKHFNNFRAILARWDKQLAYGKRQGPCQQLAAILKGD